MEPARDEREYQAAAIRAFRPEPAAMEPARDEREYLNPDLTRSFTAGPQWSPLGMSGNTYPLGCDGHRRAQAAMEPARDEREYQPPGARRHAGGQAAMEPARDEREYAGVTWVPNTHNSMPQWSPLGMSGNTTRSGSQMWAASLPQWSPLGM